MPHSVDFGGAISSAEKDEGKTKGFRLYYPMWVMPLAVLLDLKELRPHLEIQDKLVGFVSGMMIAIFVSHQWVSFAHPDPDMVQFRALQGVLRGIISGEIKVEGDAAHQLLCKSRTKMTEEQVEQIRVAHVWYDWFSCPQINARNASQEANLDLQAAVDSIPAYVNLSNFFFILAPPVTHCQLKATDCDYSSWRTRGWCRLELFAWVAADNKAPIILVKGVSAAHFINAMQWLYDLPGAGIFTVESDRARIGPVTERLLDWKLTTLLKSQSQEDLHDWRFFLAMRGRFLKGLETPPRYDTLDEFLAAFQFRTPLDTIQSGAGKGWTALHYAAITGGEVLSQLVASRCDVNGRTRVDYPRALLMSGSSPLIVAAALGSAAAVRALLQLRADPRQTDDEGYSPLVGLVRARDVDTSVITDLLHARADVNQPGNWPLSYGPLHAAASASSPAAISALMDLKADTGAICAFGTSLMAASFWNDADAVQVLLDKNMDPNEKWDTRCTGRWALCMAARAACAMGAASFALETFALIDGSTALMYATLGGQPKTVRVLLSARADPLARNSNGRTAASLAQAHGYADILSVIEEAIAASSSAPARCLPYAWTCGPSCGTGDDEEAATLVDSYGALHSEAEQVVDGWKTAVIAPASGAKLKASL